MFLQESINNFNVISGNYVSNAVLLNTYIRLNYLVSTSKNKIQDSWRLSYSPNHQYVLIHSHTSLLSKNCMHVLKGAKNNGRCMVIA